MPDLLTIRIIRFILYRLGYDLVHVEAFGYKELAPRRIDRLELFTIGRLYGEAYISLYVYVCICFTVVYG
jgi:hypothetical protein